MTTQKLFSWLNKSSIALILAAVNLPAISAQPVDWEALAKLTPGRTKAENALWIENALSARFNSSKRVVVADLKGPALITMIHFAMPPDPEAQPRRVAADVLGWRAGSERGRAVGGLLLRPERNARGGSTPRWSTNGADSTPISRCRFAFRPKWNWFMTAHWSRGRSSGKSCPAIPT